MKLAPVATLRDQVADQLRARILQGNLPPGSELKQDRLAEEFGVSRIPVREALLMLKYDGLVVVKPNRRVVVAAVTDEDIWDHYCMRALIEGEAAARAATGKGTDLSVLAAAVQRNEDAAHADDSVEFLATGEDFHHLIWDAAGGIHLKNVANQLWSGRDYTPDHLLKQLKRTADEHHFIFTAMSLRSPETARQAMAEHIMRIAEELQIYRDQVAADNRVPDEHSIQ